MAIRVMLVEDQKMVSEVLCILLSRETEMEIVATPHDGREAVRLAREMKPDVIVMDIAMPEMNGLEACRRIMAENPASRVIILSMYMERRYVQDALRAGARGYVQKNSAFKMLPEAIRSVAGDGLFLDPEITGFVMSDYTRQSHDQNLPKEDDISPRELDVLKLMAEGNSVREIAGILDVSPKTVEIHRMHIMKKLKLTNIADLTRYAIREGITTV